MTVSLVYGELGTVNAYCIDICTYGRYNCLNRRQFSVKAKAAKPLDGILRAATSVDVAPAAMISWAAVLLMGYPVEDAVLVAQEVGDHLLDLGFGAGEGNVADGNNSAITLREGAGVEDYYV